MAIPLALGLALPALGATTLVTGIVTTVASIGLSFLMKALQPKPKQEVAAQQFSSRQSIPARRRSYGYQQLSGPKIAYDSYAGAYFDGVYLGEGPYERLRHVLFDDVQSIVPEGTNASNANVAPWLGWVEWDWRRGDASQTPDHLLLQLPYWTNDHRLDGCAHITLRAFAPPEKHFKKVYPSGRPPEIRAGLSTSLVRDCRDPAQTTDPATWRYSELAGPCIYDFVTHPRWGMRVPHELMNVASWSAFNDLCAEAVPIKAGGTQERYRLGGTYEMTEDPADVLKQMLATCDGALSLEIDGTVGIRGGKFPVPTVTITADCILSFASFEEGTGKLSAFNRLKTSFTSPNHDFQLIEGDAWDDLASQDEAGEVLEADFSRAWVPYHPQLRRLAKIYTGKENPKFRFTGLVTSMAGAGGLFEESVRLVIPELDIDGTFLVRRAVARPETKTCLYDLTSIEPEIYEFDPATEEGLEPPLPDGSSLTATEIPAPAGLLASAKRAAVSGAVNVVTLELVCDTPDRADLSLEGRYRVAGSSDSWSDMAPDSDDSYHVVSAPLEDGRTYEVEGALCTYERSLIGPWTPAGTITAVADPDAPTQPQNFTVGDAGGGGVVVDWTNPASPNFSNVVVRRAPGIDAQYGASSVIGAPVYGSPNQAMEIGDTGLSPGTYRYWLVARNGSGASAAPLGPMDVTIA